MASWESEYDAWDPIEVNIYEEITGGDIQDDYLEILYHEALFDRDLSPEMRENFLDQLIDYLWDEYDIDFDDVMDWEAFREWYG